MQRPFVHINVAMTADGKIDTFERRGAAISSDADKQRVDRLRAEADAVMVGGRTLLDEDPRLTVRSEALRAERAARGLPPHPAKVGVVSKADLRPESRFLTDGPARVLIFTTSATPAAQIELLRGRGAQVFVGAGAQVDLAAALQTLHEQGIRRLMVEGGGTLNFELLRRGLVDEISAYIAPLIAGGAQAPTLADGAGLTREEAVTLELVEISKMDDDGAIVRYKVKSKAENVKT